MIRLIPRPADQEYLLAQPRLGGGDQRLVMYYDREALGDCDEISTLAGRPTCQISQSHARFNSSNNQMITIDIRITPKLITSS